jgi:hypothetical protein
MPDGSDERRAKRASWPIKQFRLGEEPPDWAGTTAEQRLAAMWEIALQTWRVAGLPIPDYDRAHTPIRVCRLGDDE